MEPTSDSEASYALISAGKTTNANLSNYLSLANQIMGVVVFIAALIAFAFIVIFVVSDLIVDENKKNYFTFKGFRLRK